jgi:type 1 glutamine amidotransferase
MPARLIHARRLWSNLAGGAAVALAGLSLVAQARPPQPASSARTAAAQEADARPLRVLLLGHHRPLHPSPAVYQLLAAPLARRGIQLTHVLTPDEAITPEKLAHYDVLMIYGNHETLTPVQEKTLLGFVEGGKGLVAIHSASAMFPASSAYGSMLGGKFERHGAGEFTAEIVRSDHPVTQGLTSFSTWDETYVHTAHNSENRTVLMERVDGDGREPWTWVRTQGKGRVFYTAYGHDQRTWSQPGFHKLIEQGTVWAAPEGARRAWVELKMPEVTYVDTFIVPNYEIRLRSTSCRSRPKSR